MATANRNLRDTDENNEKWNDKQNETLESGDEIQSFSSLIGEFASSTSAHGIGKIYAAKSNYRRLLWVLSVLLVYSLMFWMCGQLLARFIRKPVISRVEVSQEKHLEFPSVTICNLNMLKRGFVQRRKELYSQLQALKNTSDDATQTAQNPAEIKDDTPITQEQTKRRPKKKNSKKRRPKTKQKQSRQNATTPSPVATTQNPISQVPTIQRPTRNKPPKTKQQLRQNATAPSPVATTQNPISQVPTIQRPTRNKPPKAKKPNKPKIKKPNKPKTKKFQTQKRKKKKSKKSRKQRGKKYKQRQMKLAKSKSERKLFAGADIDTSNMMTKMADKLLRNTPVQYLKSMGHSLDELVVDCRWSQFKCNTGSLKKLWKQFWHWKYGNCYTFNSGTDTNGEKTPVLTVDQAGPYDGLELLIDVNQNEYMQYTEEAGIRVVLTDQGKMPFPFDEGFSVPTGFSTSVGVRRIHTRRVDLYGNHSCVSETSSVDIEDFYKKQFNVGYSVLTCRNSCLASKQRRKCNCSETRFPMSNTSSCETEEQQDCVDEVVKHYQKKAMECARKCPQPCLDNVYRYTLSNAKWSSKYLNKIVKKFKWKFQNNPSLLGDNFLKLSIFYKELTLEKIIYEEAYPLENLLADFGGQLGLWIGISILTAGEVIELIVNLVTFACSKWKRKGKANFDHSIAMNRYS